MSIFPGDKSKAGHQQNGNVASPGSWFTGKNRDIVWCPSRHCHPAKTPLLSETSWGLSSTYKKLKSIKLAENRPFPCFTIADLLGFVALVIWVLRQILIQLLKSCFILRYMKQCEQQWQKDSRRHRHVHTSWHQPLPGHQATKVPLGHQGWAKYTAACHDGDGQRCFSTRHTKHHGPKDFLPSQNQPLGRHESEYTGKRKGHSGLDIIAWFPVYPGKQRHELVYAVVLP